VVPRQTDVISRGGGGGGGRGGALGPGRNSTKAMWWCLL